MSDESELARMRVRRRLALAASCTAWATAALLLGTTSGMAQQRALWLEPGPAAVLPRVRGQLSDLGFALEETRLDDRSGAALRALATAHDARAVLWAEPLAPSGLRLLVYEPTQHRLFRRDFPAPDTPSEQSAAVEALAVGVRSALQALMAGEAAGEVVEPGTQQPATTTTGPSDDASAHIDDATSDGTRTDDDASSDTSTLQHASAWWAELGAGWRVAGDGLGASQGPSAALRAGYSRWAVELGYAAGLTREVTLAGAVLALHEHRATAALQRHLPVAAALDVVPGLGGGFLVWTRDTQSLPAGLMSTPASTALSGVLEAGCALRWHALRTRTLVLGAELAASATLVLAPPSLRVQTPSGTVEQDGWRVQPAGRLQLFVRFPGLAAR